MIGLPEGVMMHDAICRMEGCDYGSGGACTRCGARLRCDICGRFITTATVDSHYLPHLSAAVDQPGAET